MKSSLEINLSSVGNYKWNLQCIRDRKIRIAVVYDIPLSVPEDELISMGFGLFNFGEGMPFTEAREALIRLRDQDDRTWVIQSHNTALISNDLLRPDCYFTWRKDGPPVPFHLATEKSLRKAHNLEKMFRAGAFG